MEIYPRYINHENSIKNSGEKKIFSFLKNINLSEENFSLHSFNMSGDRKRTWYEIDFIIICQRAIIAIEVKAAPVWKDKDGLWHVGESYVKRESPAHQIAINSKKFREHFVLRKLNLDRRIIPCLVLFQNHKKGYSSKEAPLDIDDDLCAYKEDLFSENKFKDFLNRAIEHYFRDNKNQNIKYLSIQKIGEAKKYFRQEFDVGIASVKNLELEQVSLTEEQYKICDHFENFDRVIFEGCAGTGKTFLALYIARNWGSLGKKICYITSSRFSKNYLYLTNEKNIRGNFDILHISEISNLLKEKLLYDGIIIDEGQQMCVPEFLDNIDKILKGGIQNGLWRWFGDVKNQILDENLFDLESYELLKEYTGNNALKELEHNVRNTPQICNYVEYIGINLGNPIVNGHGPEVNSFNKLQLKNKIKSWLKENISIQNDKHKIIFLCASKEQYEEATIICKELDLNYSYIYENKDTLICISLIEDFRGLEAPMVILLGIESFKDVDFIKFVYQGVSRSNADALILTENTDIFNNRLYKINKKINNL